MYRRALAVFVLVLGVSGCGRASAPETRDVAPQTAEASTETLTIPSPKLSRDETSVMFEAEPNAVEHVLALTQTDIQARWELRINGQVIGMLHRQAGPVRAHFAIPPEVLVSGANELALTTPDTGAPLELADIQIHQVPLAELLGQVHVRVRDAEGGHGLPARLSVVDEKGRLVAIMTAEEGDFAIRPGIAYVDADGRGFGLPAGDYELFVTRGMEWSLGRASIHIEAGQSLEQIIELRREVDTSGWIAADTHIHTLTHSGHGDASVRERVLTLAGEGVELAVATDHNHHTDFHPLQAELGLSEHFAAITGNEVTTDNGHFSAFPFAPDAAPPNHEERDWVKLVASMRAAGAKVVILNHPHWPKLHTGPFAVFGLDPVTGARASGTEFTFDGMELVNSTTLDPEPFALLHDWFALLNRGESIVAVGSSDSHTVGDPVGQGRCYVPSQTDDPAAIDVEAATQAYLDGRVSVALGIFTDLRVGAKPKQAVPGDMVGFEEGRVPVKVRVAAPGWVRPREAIVFVNGVEAARVPVPTSEGATDAWLETEIDLGERDSYVVAVVIGEGVSVPGWPLMADYTFAATNPVYVERDGKRGWKWPGPGAGEATHSHAAP